jgi:tetratricopeptide (TPR) repeat protein
MKEINAENEKDSDESLLAVLSTAGTFSTNQEFGKAEKFLLKSLKKCYSRLGTSPTIKNQQTLGHVLSLLARNYSCQGQYATAKDTYTKILDIYKNIPGVDSEVVGINCAMAEIDAKNTNYDNAIETLEKLLGSCGVEEISHLSQRLCLAYARNGKLDMAMETGLKSLRHSEKMGQRGEVGRALFVLSFVLCEKREWVQALSKIEETLPILRAEFGEKSPIVVDTLALLGGIYTCQGKYDDGLKILQKALRYARRFVSDSPSSLIELTRRIIRLYTHMGQFDQIQKMLAKDEALFRSLMPDLFSPTSCCSRGFDCFKGIKSSK